MIKTLTVKLIHNPAKDALYQAGYHDAKNGVPFTKGENDFPYAGDAQRYSDGYLYYAMFERTAN